MITVNICGTKHEYDDALESWINERHRNIKKVGGDFWFKITVKTNEINLNLASAGAPAGKGIPYSHFNYRERQIIDMWNEIGVNQDDNVNVLLRFLNNLKQIVT